MSDMAPLWSFAELVSDSAQPDGFQVSLEDIVSHTGRLVEGELSSYTAKGTPFVEGDVLFGKLRPYLAKYWLADRSGTAGGDIHVYRPAEKAEPRYLQYIVGSENFIKFADASSKGTKMPRAEWMSLREFPAPQHDLQTQRHIADYLDRETGQIDAMSDKLDELYRELKVRRERVIHETFFSDGIECLPTPLHAVADSEDHMRIPLKAEDRGSMQGEYPYYGASGIIDHLDSYIWDEATRVLISEDGANLVARSAPIAFIADGKFWVNNHAHVLKAKPDVDARLIVYSMAVTDISHSITGSAQPKLTADALWRLKVPFPSDFAKSKDLADHLDDVTSKIDAMLSKVAELKDLLTERRAALITDVVTGRKEVA